jgi:hypothetical protein
MRGTMHFVTPSDSLEMYFAQAATKYGVELVDTRVNKMEVRFGKIRRIITDSAEIEARIVLFNTHKSPTQWITHKGALKRLKKEFTTLSDKTKWSLNILIDSAAIPESLGDIAFCLPRKISDAEDLQMLRIFPAFNNGNGVKNNNASQQKVIMLSGWCAREDSTRMSAEARWQALKGKIEAFLPFSEQHILHISSPEENQIDNDLGHSQLFESGKKCDLLGVGRSSLRSGLKNMVYSTGAVLPGFGIEGDYITALAVVRTVLNLEQPSWKPLRELPL